MRSSWIPAIAVWAWWTACSSESLPSRLYDVTSAGELLGVRPRTVRAWIDQGLLPCRRVGPRLIRISPADLEEFMRRSEDVAR